MLEFEEIKKSIKASTGITLIALVITIIVLLILAGISILMLSGENSILQKATTAKTSSEKEEAKEQAQIDIMAWVTDKTTKNEDSTLNDNKVKEILTGKSYVKEAKDTSFITAKGEHEILYSEIYATRDKMPDDFGSTAIDYGSKTAQTIRRGEDLTIGTEKFKVFKKANGTIFAMPYYNLKLDETPIKQITQANAETESMSSTNNVYFSPLEEPTWNPSEDINMSLHENNIQSYVEAYQTTLRNLGASNVIVRIATHNEIYNMNDTNTYGELINPSKTASFWVGTSIYDATQICFINPGGQIEALPYNGIPEQPEIGWVSLGVRPIILIPYDDTNDDISLDDDYFNNINSGYDSGSGYSSGYDNGSGYGGSGYSSGYDSGSGY